MNLDETRSGGFACYIRGRSVWYSVNKLPHLRRELNSQPFGKQPHVKTPNVRYHISPQITDLISHTEPPFQLLRPYLQFRTSRLGGQSLEFLKLSREVVEDMCAYERGDLDAGNRDLPFWRSLQVLDMIQSSLEAMKLEYQFLIFGSGWGAQYLDDVFDKLASGDEVADCESKWHGSYWELIFYDVDGRSVRGQQWTEKAETRRGWALNDRGCASVIPTSSLGKRSADSVSPWGQLVHFHIQLGADSPSESLKEPFWNQQSALRSRQSN